MGTRPYHPDDVARRGVDYTYDGDPDTVDWLDSQLKHGTHQLAIELVVGRDYELWLMLQDPTEPKNWLPQEPIIRTGSNSHDPP